MKITRIQVIFLLSLLVIGTNTRLVHNEAHDFETQGSENHDSVSLKSHLEQIKSHIAILEDNLHQLSGQMKDHIAQVHFDD